MRVLITAAFLFLVGCVHNQIEKHPEPKDYASFEKCVDQHAMAEAEIAYQEEGDVALLGYHTDTYKIMLSMCASKPNDAREIQYVGSAVNAAYQVLLKKKIDVEMDAARKKAAEDAPRLAAEEKERTRISTLYFQCLVTASETLAIASTEAADLVVRAAFPTCMKQRQAVFDIYRQQNQSFNEDIMQAMEKRFTNSLLLAVIDARVKARTSHPQSAPARHPLEKSL